MAKDKVLTTAASVAALEPRTVRYSVRDSKVIGLELRIRPDGTKTWTLRYRALGQQRRLKLGEYPRVGLADARLRASRELRKVDHGVDPQAERRAAQAALEAAKKDSIDALVAAYIERHAMKRKRTWRDDQSKLRCEVLPRWKGRPVTSITRRDCRELVRAIADRGAPIYANRVYEVVRKMFNYALDEEILTSNPAARLRKPGVEAQARPEGEREEKPYTEDEIRRIWANTETLTSAERGPIRLGLITGQRPSECADLEWAEVDALWWTLPPSRTKNGRTHRVFLSPMALDELATVPRVLDEPRAFPGMKGKRQRAAANKAIFAGVRRRQKPRHALRDTAATGLAECGVAIENISKTLNHAYGPKVTAGYNAYAYDKEKRLALGKWARRLAAILDRQESRPTVVAFSREA